MRRLESAEPRPARSPLRLAVLLDGNPHRHGAAASKFGLFVEALKAQVDVVEVGDASLRGVPRVVAAVATWHPARPSWREHYRKNPLTFTLRSRKSRDWLRSLPWQPQAVLQVGAMSDPALPSSIPFALYLDFTYALTRREWPERVPMSAVERVIWRRLEQRTYDRAALIFCRSDYVARSLRDDYRVDPSKIRVVGAGVNLSLPDPRTLGAQQGPRVVFIGNDFRRKGGDSLLAAWPNVRRQIPDAELVIIGPAPDVVPAGVAVHRNRWDSMLIIRELHRASVFAMPSRCETWGDVFVEAMAYALPCVGTDRDAMPEVIAHGETGLLVPVDDPDALADALVQLLADPDRARTMGMAGRARVEQRFLWPDVIGRMVHDLEQVVAQRAGSTSR